MFRASRSKDATFTDNNRNAEASNMMIKETEDDCIRESGVDGKVSVEY